MAVGKGQDAKLVKGGLTGREMAWFKGAGRGAHGAFSTTCGVVDTKEKGVALNMRVTTEGGEGMLPLRSVLFAMDVTVKRLLEERTEEVAETHGKCGTHHCTNCGNCEEMDWDVTMCCMDDDRVCDGCLNC